MTVTVIEAIAREFRRTEEEENMNLLHKKSILDCTELEERIHQVETNQLLQKILSLPNFDCDFEVTFEDDYHKEMNNPYSTNPIFIRFRILWKLGILKWCRYTIDERQSSGLSCLW